MRFSSSSALDSAIHVYQAWNIYMNYWSILHDLPMAPYFLSTKSCTKRSPSGVATCRDPWAKLNTPWGSSLAPMLMEALAPWGSMDAAPVGDTPEKTRIVSQIFYRKHWYMWRVIYNTSWYLHVSFYSSSSIFFIQNDSILNSLHLIRFQQWGQNWKLWHTCGLYIGEDDLEILIGFWCFISKRF